MENDQGNNINNTQKTEQELLNEIQDISFDSNVDCSFSSNDIQNSIDILNSQKEKYLTIMNLDPCRVQEYKSMVRKIKYQINQMQDMMAVIKNDGKGKKELLYDICYIISDCDRLSYSREYVQKSIRMMNMIKEKYEIIIETNSLDHSELEEYELRVRYIEFGITAMNNLNVLLEFMQEKNIELGDLIDGVLKNKWYAIDKYLLIYKQNKDFNLDPENKEKLEALIDAVKNSWSLKSFGEIRPDPNMKYYSFDYYDRANYSLSNEGIIGRENFFSDWKRFVRPPHSLYDMRARYEIIYPNKQEYKLPLPINLALYWLERCYILLFQIFGWKIKQASTFNQVLDSKKKDMQELLYTIVSMYDIWGNKRDNVINQSTEELANSILYRAERGNKECQKFVIEHFEPIMVTPQVVQQTVSSNQTRGWNSGWGNNPEHLIRP